jgi:hypothetical protein
MAIRDKMRHSAAQYLQPGEQLEAVIGAQTRSNYLIVVSGLLFYAINNYRIVAVTNNRILVLNAGKWSMSKARGVVTEVPRFTRLGPGRGVWHRVQVGGEKLRVHRRFFKDVDVADRPVTIG